MLIGMKILKKISIRNNKGYTAIEILIALSLFGSIVGLATASYVNTMNICGTLDKKVELQQQGLFILSFLEEKIIESEGIHAIREKVNDKLYTTEPAKVHRIVFKNNTIDKGYVFSLTGPSKPGIYNLSYRKGLIGTGTVEVGNYIEYIEVEPLPVGSMFVDAKGIVVRINLVLDDCSICIEDAFCFRNKSGSF